MKPEKLILVLFVCMGILLAMIYGVFEIGGLEMGKCGKIVFGLLVCFFVLIVAFVILIFIYECFLDIGNNNRIYISDIKAIELEGDLHSFYVIKDGKKDKAPGKTQAVIYCGSDVLKQSHFENTGSLRCIAFAGSGYKIEKDLYKTFIENNVNITICNGSVLTLVNEDGDAVSSVSIMQRKKPGKQQECAVNGKIDLSVQKR